MAHEHPASPDTAPIPVHGRRPSWREAFSSVSIPNFRRFIIAYVLIVTSISMQRIMLAWSVLEVSGDLAHVGAAIAVQYLPMLLLGPAGGVVADRWSKRSTLLLCQVVLLALAVAVLVASAIAPLHIMLIYILGACIGVVQAFQMPAAQGIIGEMVSARHLSPAVSLTSSAFQAGQIVGPALGGFLLAYLEPTWAWGANLAVVGISLLVLRRIRVAPLTVPRRPVSTSMGGVAGLRYVRRKPEIVLVLALVLAVSCCAYATPVYLTAYANDEFAIGASGYGVLNSIMAFGAMGGAVLSAKRSAPTMATILICTVALAVSQVAMGIISALPLFVLVLAARGAASLFATTAMNAFIQLRTQPIYRGRVLGFYGMMMNGGMAAGNVLMGGLVAAFGVRFVATTTGAVIALCALAAWLMLWGLRTRRRR